MHPSMSLLARLASLPVLVAAAISLPACSGEEPADGMTAVDVSASGKDEASPPGLGLPGPVADASGSRGGSDWNDDATAADPGGRAQVRPGETDTRTLGAQAQVQLPAQGDRN